eukprot:4243020-Amphidinium_carterae.1
MSSQMSAFIHTHESHSRHPNPQQPPPCQRLVRRGKTLESRNPGMNICSILRRACPEKGLPSASKPPSPPRPVCRSVPIQPKVGAS